MAVAPAEAHEPGEAERVLVAGAGPVELPVIEHDLLVNELQEPELALVDTELLQLKINDLADARPAK